MEDGLAEAYADETARVIRRRMSFGIGLFVPLVTVACVLEALHHPERGRLLVMLYAVEMAAAGLALATLRLPSMARHGAPIAAVFVIAVVVCLGFYNAIIQSPAERYAMGQVCLLTGTAVLLPWGWRWQLVTSLATLAAFGGAAPHLESADGIDFSALSLLVGAGTSVCGALFLDQYRADGFVQASRQREEAEIAGALLRLGQQLAAGLERSDLLDGVAAFAAAELPCDQTSIFTWEVAEEAFRLRASTGLRPEVLEELDALQFTRDSLPIVRAALVPGAMVEIERPEGQLLVPPTLMERWDITSLLVAPIERGAGVVGVLVAEHRHRTGPFSVRERRLARGMAQATALALENARLIRDLQTASRLKTEFVSTMSHELRTPLNVILGYAEMASDPGFDATALRVHADRIEHAGRELLDLIERTLEIGRIELGRDAVRLEPVLLSTLWADLHAACSRMPRTDGVVLRWSDTAPRVSLLTDPRKLTLILRNLVGNALKFTAAGSVTVDARVEDDAVVLRVTDTGIGIRPEDCETIFDIFRQADGSDTRRYGGVGLGLYIVRRCVQQLDGGVHLESRVGAGSVFTVRLPIATTARPVRTAA